MVAVGGSTNGDRASQLLFMTWAWIVSLSYQHLSAREQRHAITHHRTCLFMQMRAAHVRSRETQAPRCDI